MKKIIYALFAATFTLGGLAACTNEADTVSDNLSTDADNFKIQRRITFVNGITDKYLLVIEGRCSLGNYDEEYQKSVTCKIGDHKYVKHIVHLSDNVTFVMQQMEGTYADAYHHKITFRPETILPDVDLRTSNDTEFVPEDEGNGVVEDTK